MPRLALPRLALPRLALPVAALLASLTTVVAPTRAARAQLSVLGNTVQEFATTPGQSHSGTVLVANASADAQTVRVYLTDYWFNAKGETRYEPPASRPRSNAAWVALEASQLTVPAGATLPVRYTLRTPPRLDSAGTFWSLLMIEPVPLAGATPGAGQFSLTTSVRYAVQLASHVADSTGAGGAPPAAQISAPRAGESNGQLTIAFDLENSGAVGYRPELSIELIDASGRSVGTFHERRGLLYPGTSLRQRFECAGVPRGAYTAVIVADTGDDVFGAQVPIRW